MNKNKSKSIVQRILGNIFVKNLLIMAIIFLALAGIVLVALDFYTHHDESVTVPLVKGLQAEEAAAILQSEGLRYEIVDSVYQDTGTPGAIIEQVPQGESKVKKGRLVFLTIQTKNQQMVSIPPLLDFSQRQAEAQLSALGFNRIAIRQEPSQYKDIVLSILYRGREVDPSVKIPKGAPLTIVIGAGGQEETDSTYLDQSDIEPASNPFFD